MRAQALRTVAAVLNVFSSLALLGALLYFFVGWSKVDRSFTGFNDSLKSFNRAYQAEVESNRAMRERNLKIEAAIWRAKEQELGIKRQGPRTAEERYFDEVYEEGHRSLLNRKK